MTEIGTSAVNLKKHNNVLYNTNKTSPVMFDLCRPRAKEILFGPLEHENDEPEDCMGKFCWQIESLGKAQQEKKLSPLPAWCTDPNICIESSSTRSILALSH